MNTHMDVSTEKVCLKETAAKSKYFAVKRAFDVVLTSCALIILSPLFLLIAIAIRLDSRGPVIYGHQRIGKNGIPFKMYKFRSMVINADQLIDSFTPEQKKEYYENFKLEKDPRITKVGNFLRKTSLDELPQLINVLKGELSLVGPRPIVEAELEKYGVHKERFLSVAPGVTGYWQANGRSDTTYEQRMEMELYYVDHASFILDLKILWDTVWAVLRRQGAR